MSKQLKRSEDILLKALAALDVAPKGIDFKAGLFIQQQAFFDDPARFKAAVCSRRAGKTHTAAAMLIDAALKARESPLGAGAQCLYIALTRDSAKGIMWPTLLEMLRRQRIKYTAKESELAIVLGDIHIRLVGADMKQMRERLRGPKYAIVVLDEAGSFGEHIKELIDDVLTAALLDLDGSLVLIGTPAVLPQGFFYESTTTGEYSTHRWTLRNNPHIRNTDKFLADLLKRKRWTADNPTYRREYLGEWVEDTDSLVYKFNPQRNRYTDLPADISWSYVIGMDYGWNDATSWSVIAFSLHSPAAYVVHNEAAPELTPSAIAERTRQLVEQYKPVNICVDVGGLGKSITEELKQRYGLPVEAAEKTEKLTYIDLINGDFIDGKLFVHEGLKPLIAQYRALAKDEKGKEHPGMPNDRCDSTLYAYRKALHYIGESPKAAAARGSAEWAREQERQFLEAVERDLKPSDVPWWVQ